MITEAFPSPMKRLKSYVKKSPAELRGTTTSENNAGLGVMAMTDRDPGEAWQMLEEIHEAVTAKTDAPDMPRWYPKETSEIMEVLRIINNSDTVTAKNVESIADITDGSRPAFELWRLGYINRREDESGTYIYSGLTEWGKEVLDTDQTSINDVQKQAGRSQGGIKDGESKYRCEKCGEEFNDNSKYGGHMAAHKSNEMYWTNPNGSNVTDERAKTILKTAKDLPVERFYSGQLNAFIDYEATSYLTRLYRAGAVNRTEDSSNDGRKKYIYWLSRDAEEWLDSQFE